MAQVRLFRPGDIQNPTGFFGDVIELTPSRLVLSDGFRQAAYEGQLFYDRFGLTGGTLTAVTLYERNQPTVDIFGFSTPILPLARPIDDGDIATVFRTVLAGADRILGSAGDDRLAGYAGDDYIEAGPGNDSLLGGAGNDVLWGGPGNDRISGGDGIDAALFETLRRQEVLSGNPAASATITGPAGTDSLDTVEILRFYDGSLSFSAYTQTGQALRLYQAALGRAPDAIGLGSYTEALESGRLSVSSAAGQFASSQEFTLRYGALDNTGFVTVLYQNALGRAPDAPGLANWVGALNAGLISRGDAVAGFSESNEAILRSVPAFNAGVWAPEPASVDVVRLYQTMFDRLPDQAGLLAWTQARAGGLSYGELLQAFASSAEFQGLYGGTSNRDFVARLYLNALDRPGDPGGLAAWTGALDAGQLTRADVVTGFAFSTEMTVKIAPRVSDPGGFLFT
jgi:hypothetical protein